MEKRKTTLLIAAAMTSSITMAIAAEPSVPSTTSNAAPAKAEAKAVFSQADQFNWGGDIRIREVYFDNIPYANGGQARGGANHFQRYRTRVFGEYHPNDQLYFRARLVNEFRTVEQPDGQNPWSAWDETVFDNLFVDYKSDLFDVRLGRQDMMYGTGKVILDGTPKDGSRTIYFDAAKATYKGIEDTTVDFFAMYTYAKDMLAIHSQDRDIVGLAGGNAYDGAEAGGGVYVKNKTYKDLPWEAYFIRKTQEQDVAFLNNDPRNTIGTRLMPKWSEAFDGNLELAYQSGEQISAYMVDALANWRIADLKEQKACLGLGWYYLSGDNQGSAKDEGWDPVFARWPQYSELYVYAYDTQGAGRWSNVSMPHIDFSISPCKNLKSDFLLGYMFAPEADGIGGGHNRGLLFTWWNRFTIKEKIFSDKDKLGGHVLLELMDPDDYYSASQQNKTAVFARVEMNYSF